MNTYSLQLMSFFEVLIVSCLGWRVSLSTVATAQGTLGRRTTRLPSNSAYIHSVGAQSLTEYKAGLCAYTRPYLISLISIHIAITVPFKSFTFISFISLEADIAQLLCFPFTPQGYARGAKTQEKNAST